MIDLIIPYYNNLIGLNQSLESIDHDIFYITIVDDHSKHSPVKPKAHQVFRYNENCGPGYARQHGINKTSNPYIMFLDTGDIFLSKEVQKTILDTITQHPEVNVFIFPYIANSTKTTQLDNTMHGKVYKRSFLEKYGISFAPIDSYMDEDVGFNHTCRLCTKFENQPIFFLDTPVIEWIFDKDSLTQKNNHEKSFKQQTYGLATNIIHTINICEKNNIDTYEEIHYIATALYYWFVHTAAVRPEFIQDAWSGAKIFFDRFKDVINPHQLTIGNKYFINTLKMKHEVPFSINIIRFVDDIENNSIIPDYYLTFSQN